VTAVAYFAATFLGQQMKLRILCEKLLIISQRFFGIPPFRFYALADGIRRILSAGTFSPPPEPPASLQLEWLIGLCSGRGRIMDACRIATSTPRSWAFKVPGRWTGWS
jgi:hypothetical protein